jgi:hypothetical protein
MSRAILKRALIVSVATSLLLVVVMALFGSSLPPWQMPNPEGFHQAIAWFEVARSPDEIFAALGPLDSAGLALRGAMARVNAVDFAFMWSYTVLNGCLLLLLWPRTRVWIAVTLVLCVAMLIGDAIENVMLFDLASAASPEQVSLTSLLLLRIFTSLKWSSLFVAGVLIGWRLRYANVISVATAAVGFWGLFGATSRGLLELSVPGFTIVWLWAFFSVVRGEATGRDQ